MQGLNDDERRDVLGELFADELKVILEYVKDIPAIQDAVIVLDAKVGRLESRFTVFEHMLKEHDKELKVHDKAIKTLKAKIA